MREGWMRAAVLAVVLLLLAFYTFVRQAPERSDVDRLEAQLTRQQVAGAYQGTPPIGGYVRYYANARPKGWSDLPFTARGPIARFPRDRRLIVGVLVDPSGWPHARPGIHRVRLNRLPSIGDGGCGVVNVVYDPKDDALLGAWCNGSPRPSVREAAARGAVPRS
jgi:hypothetical protein